MASLGEFVVYLWRLSRPEFWVVSVMPGYWGYLLASRELVPGLRLWLDFWSAAASRGATTDQFFQTLLAWATVSRDLLLAFVVLGPLLWAATLLINDVYDLPGDRVNPRKSRSPLVQGLVDEGWAKAAAYGFALLSLAVAAFVNVPFLLLVLGCLALAWIYSVPPLRLKERAGADVLLNAVGVGVLAGLAGWSVARPIQEAPFVFAPQALLVVTAVYVPTTLADFEADRAVGYRTLATTLGYRRAYWVGFSAWVLCNLGAILCSWNEWYIPRRMLPLLLIFCPLLLYEYHQFIGRAKSGPEMMNGIALCSATFFCIMFVWALMYTGLWVA